MDVLIRWVAPYDGVIDIDAAFTLQSYVTNIIINLFLSFIVLLVLQ